MLVLIDFEITSFSIEVMPQMHKTVAKIRVKLQVHKAILLMKEKIQFMLCCGVLIYLFSNDNLCLLSGKLRCEMPVW